MWYLIGLSVISLVVFLFLFAYRRHYMSDPTMKLLVGFIDQLQKRGWQGIQQAQGDFVLIPPDLYNLAEKELINTPYCSALDLLLAWEQEAKTPLTVSSSIQPGAGTAIFGVIVVYFDGSMNPKIFDISGECPKKIKAKDLPDALLAISDSIEKSAGQFRQYFSR